MAKTKQVWSHHIKSSTAGQYFPNIPDSSVLGHSVGFTGSNGWTLVTDDNMSDTGYVGGSNAQRITNASGGYSDPYRIRGNWSIGDTPDSNPDGDVFVTEGPFTNRKKIYASWIFYIPSNFQYNHGGGTKLGPWIGIYEIESPDTDQLGQSIFLRIDDTGQEYISWENQGGGNNHPSTTIMSKGALHELETIWVGNTGSGSNNGTIQTWLDGVLIINESGKNFRAGACTFWGTRWHPYWGGSGDSFSVNTYIECDHHLVLTSP